MPELPEVETTRRGIAPYVEGQAITAVQVRQPQLRWPVSPEVSQLPGLVIDRVGRRAKYLLFHTRAGQLLVHLGMSGSLRVLPPGERPAAGIHDHVDIAFSNDCLLRLHDPRRFGAVIWYGGNEPQPLLQHLGPEPLEAGFTADYLYQKSRGRRAPVKNFIMDGRIVVGVGNIYAAEALFHAGIRPGRAAGRISLPRYEGLVRAIREVLAAAIDSGGSTLRDFVGSDGEPGYFTQSLTVYGREDEACVRCGAALRLQRIGGRASVFCPQCQR